MLKKGQLIHLFLVLCLCAAFLVPPASAASDIYFTSVNDTMLTLTAETMPYRSGGVLYVPYTVFDGNSSGVPLGISCTYNRNRNTLILYDDEQIVTFYLESGVCYDEIAGGTYEKKAALHNGVPFVALDAVCLFFDLEYTYNIIPKVPQGYLVRVKNKDVILSDAKFIDAASNLIDRRYQSYLQSLPPAEGDGTTSIVPGIDEKEPSVKENSVFLAFLGDDPKEIERVLDVLVRNREYGLFFVRPELIAQEDDLIREIMGTGHGVGLWMGEEDELSVLDEGNRLLEALTYTRTTLVYAPEEKRSQLENEGWVCWEETRQLDPSATVGAYAYSDRVVNQLKKSKSNEFLTLSGVDTDRILPALLDRLSEELFDVELSLETQL